MNQQGGGHPHPAWATHAMRFQGDQSEQSCRAHAVENCPQGMSYTVRPVDGGWEWFAPAHPARLSGREKFEYFASQ